MLVDTSRQGSNFKVCYKPSKINRCMLGTGHKTIAAHIIEAVCIKLAGHNGIVHRHAPILLDHVRDIDREATPHSIKNLRNLTVLDKQIADMLVICELETKPFSNRLERVTKWTVAQIMNQRCRQRDVLSTLRALAVISNYLHELPSCKKHADAVGKPRMTSTWINQVREAKLLYTTQSLKGARLQDTPQRPFKLVILELNKIVKRIANPLQRHVRCNTRFA